jgi:hypothetical protein
MITVKSTREGLVGGTTASGWVIDTQIPFVALPSTRALWRLIRIRNPLNGIARFAFVLDVGPWNTHDDAYVFGGARPLSESQPGTNRSGIDLGEKIWQQLRMTGNTDVTWEFVN